MVVILWQIGFLVFVGLDCVNECELDEWYDY